MDETFCLNFGGIRYLIALSLEELITSGSKLPLQKFTKHIIRECKKQAAVMANVFIHYKEVLVVLVDKVFQEIVSYFLLSFGYPVL
jgi:hypothetical protein